MTHRPRNATPSAVRVRAAQVRQAVQADPIRRWIHGLVGRVVGAEEILAQYDRRLALEAEVRSLIAENEVHGARWAVVLRDLDEAARR